MLKSLRPHSTDQLDEARVKKYNAIRQIARGLKIYPLTFAETVLAADEFMDMLTRRDAHIAGLEQEIKRLNLVMANFQREITEMKAIMAKFEIHLPGEGKP